MGQKKVVVKFRASVPSIKPDSSEIQSRAKLMEPLERRQISSNTGKRLQIKGLAINNVWIQIVGSN